MLKKPNNGYYIFVRDEFMQANGTAVKLKGYEEFDFFITRMPGSIPNYCMSEGKTGRTLADGDTRKDCIGKFHCSMLRYKWSKARLKKEINKQIKLHGLSPRWRKDNGR